MLIKGLQQDPALNSIKFKMSIISKKLAGMQRSKKKKKYLYSTFLKVQ